MTTQHRTVVTAAGTRSSPDRNDCPSIHKIDGRTEAYVVIRDDADDDARRELVEHVGVGPDGRPELLGTQPPWVPCGLMDLPTLGRFMDDHLHRTGDQRFRLEQLPTYSRIGADFVAWKDGDPAPAAKREWLDKLAEDEAAGITHSRVRILTEVLTDYELYACQRGYALNSRHEAIRVLRHGEHTMPALQATGDFWLVNGIVIPMIYHADGTFVGAAYVGAADERADAYRADTARLWAAAEPWADWWGRHPEYHVEPGRAA